MQKNLCVFERVIRVLLAAIFLYAAYALFENVVARTFASLFGLYSLGEALLGVCPLNRHLGLKSQKDHLSSTTVSFLVIMWIQIVLAYEWWSAAFSKWTDTEYITNLPATLAFFASENPFPWFSSFLTGFATANAELFANLVRTGQVLTALGLFLTAALCVYAKQSRLRRSTIVIAVVALLGGIIMNLAFYFAAGWTGPGTHGINVLMFWTQATLFYFWLSQWRTVKG